MSRSFRRMASAAAMSAALVLTVGAAGAARAEMAQWGTTANAVTGNLSAQGGASIFSQLRGKQIDLGSLVEDTTTGLSIFFGEALAADALANARANIADLGASMDAYFEAPGPVPLHRAQDASAQALAELRELGLQAVGAYTIAAGLRLSILQEQMAANVTGAAEALSREAEVYSGRIDLWVAEYTKITEELFDAIQCAGLPVDPGGPSRAVADALGPAMDAANQWRLLAAR